MRTALVSSALLFALIADLTAQANSSQKWNTGTSSWEVAGPNTYDSDAVTTQVQDTISYFVLWKNGVKVFRVRYDDPSLSTGERQKLNEAAEATDPPRGVEVEVVAGPLVESVTSKP